MWKHSFLPSAIFTTAFVFATLFNISVSAEEGWKHYSRAQNITALDIHDDTVWFATENSVTALNRHTGAQQTWDVFPGITDIEIDGDGFVWVSSSYHGLTGYDPVSQRWHSFQDSLISNHIKDIEIDSRNRVYVIGNDTIDPPGEGHDLYYIQFLQRFDGESWETMLYTENLYDYETFCIDESRDIIYITDFDMLRTFIPETGDTEKYPLYNALDVTISADGTLYAANKNGAFAFCGDVFATVPGMDEQVNDLFYDSRNRFWLGTLRGLVLSENNMSTSYTVSDGLLSDTILHIAGDDDGTLWIATSGGLQSFRDGKFHIVYQEGQMPALEIKDISITHDNILYLSTCNAGVVRFDGNSWETVKSENFLNVVAYSDDDIMLNDEYLDNHGWHPYDISHIEQKIYDRNGNPWVASSNGTNLNLYTIREGRWDPASFEVEDYQAIPDITCDGNGNIWFISNTIHRYNPETEDHATVILPDINYFVNIAADNDNTIWTLCGTLHSGYMGESFLAGYTENGDIQLYPLKNAEDEPYKGPAHNFPDKIIQMVCDHDGGVWIATRYEGLYRFTDGEWRHYSAETGDLNSGILRDAEIGPDGRLWVATDTGLSVLDIETGVTTQSHDTPEETVLLGNFPNPFNPSTTITFSLPEDAQANLSVFNIAGQHVRTLADTRLRAGVHTMRWNGKDFSGNPVAAGIYIMKLTYGNRTASGKLIFIK